MIGYFLVFALACATSQAIYPPPSGPWDHEYHRPGWGQYKRDADEEIGYHPPGIYSKRDDDVEIDISDLVDNLMEKINATLEAFRNGDRDNIESDLREIGEESRAIIDVSGYSANAWDVLGFTSNIIQSLDDTINADTDRTGYAIVLINEIMKRVRQDQGELFIALRAIEEITDTTVDVLAGVGHIVKFLGKRQGTVGGYYHHTPGGPAYGVSGSYTWKGKRALAQKRQGTVGGYYHHTPGGPAYGVSGSYTWKGRRALAQK